MKKVRSIILGIVCLVVIVALTACTNIKQEEGEKSGIPAENLVKSSLLASEWKVSHTYKLNEMKRATKEVSPDEVYGKYYMEGRIIFYADGTFVRTVNPYLEEEKGTYRIDESVKTITFIFEDQTEVETGYETTSEGTVSSFSGAFDDVYAITYGDGGLR